MGQLLCARAYTRCFHRGFNSFNKPSRSGILSQINLFRSSMLPNGFINYCFDFVLMF